MHSANCKSQLDLTGYRGEGPSPIPSLLLQMNVQPTHLEKCLPDFGVIVLAPKLDGWSCEGRLCVSRPKRTATSQMKFVARSKGSTTSTTSGLRLIGAMSTEQGYKHLFYYCLFRKTYECMRLPRALYLQCFQCRVKTFLILGQEHSVPYSL